MPLVSVCIPTVDRPWYLREAIASVANQSHRDIEIVISDNSRDPENRVRNRGIVGEFSGLRIVLSQQPEQVDVVTNLNFLVDKAVGDLWCCLPDDDRLCPQAVSLAVEALENHAECGFTFADHHLMKSDGKLDPVATSRNSTLFGRTELHRGVLRHENMFPIVLQQSMCLQTMVFRRDIIRTFRFEPGTFMCDFSLALRIAAAQKPVHAYYIDERVFEYRIHPAQGTTMMSRRNQLDDAVIALRSVGRVPTRHQRQYDAKLARQLAALSLAEAEIGEVVSARTHALQSFGLSPGLRPLAALLLTRFPKVTPFARELHRRLAVRYHRSA